MDRLIDIRLLNPNLSEEETARILAEIKGTAADPANHKPSAREAERERAIGLIERYVDASEGNVSEQVLEVLLDNGISSAVANELATAYVDLDGSEDEE